MPSNATHQTVRPGHNVRTGLRRLLIRCLNSGLRKLVILFIKLCLSLTIAAAQPVPSPVDLSTELPADPPRVGLALGAGGSRGLAHIGVLKVLEEAGIPVDVVTGISMGSAVGALYASGYTPDQLEEVALEVDWNGMMQDGPRRRRLSMEEKMWDSRYFGSLPIRQGKLQLPSGLKSGQTLTGLLTRLLWTVQDVRDFRTLPIPFACVATDLTTLQAVRLEQGDLIEAIRASMAMPIVFTPVETDGRVLVDGGVVRTLPVQDAFEMGADIVVVVDLSRGRGDIGALESVGDIINASLRSARNHLHEEQQDLATVVIRPDVLDIDVLDFGSAKTIIARGEQAARAMLPHIHALVDSLHQRHNLTLEAACHDRPTRQVSVSATTPPSVYVDSVEVQGLRKVSRKLVLDPFHTTFPGWITPHELNREIERVYATQLFESVTYRLRSTPNGKRLVINVAEKTPRIFSMGLRYDSYSRTSVLLNASFRSRKRRDASLFLDLELGNRTALRAQLLKRLSRHIGLRTSTQFSQITSARMDEQHRVAEVRFRTASFSTLFTNSIYNRMLYGIGLEGTHKKVTPTLAPEDYRSVYDTRLSLVGLMWYDTYDRAFFPRRGHHFVYRLITGRRGWGSRTSSVEQSVDWRAAFPVRPRISLLTELQFYSSVVWDGAGWQPGNERHEALNRAHMPLLESAALLGGAHTPLLTTGQFLGLAKHELAGKHMKVLMLGTQYEFRPGHYAVLRANVGNTFNEWHWGVRNEHYLVGAGLTLGKITALGPVAVTVATSQRHRLLVDVSLGHTF